MSYVYWCSAPHAVFHVKKSWQLLHMAGPLRMPSESSQTELNL